MNKKVLIPIIAVIVFLVVVIIIMGGTILKMKSNGNTTTTITTTVPTTTTTGNGGITTSSGQGGQHNPSNTVSEGLEFRLNDDEVSYSLVGLGTCTDKDIVIPNQYQGLPITKIAVGAFKPKEIDYSPYYLREYLSFPSFSLDSVTSIRIPESVIEIEPGAMLECYSLSEVIVDENNSAYQSIDGNLYSKDGKTFVYYAQGKKDLTFTIPSFVNEVEANAFNGCYALVSITIPQSITSIGENFENCCSLEEICNKSSVNIKIENLHVHYVNVITDESDSKLKFIGDFAFYVNGEEVYLIKYAGNDSEVTFPEYEGGREYYIYRGIFLNNDNLTKVNIPAFVKEISSFLAMDCDNFVTVEVDSGSPYMKSVNGVVYSKDSSVLLLYPSGKKEDSFVVPSTVTEIFAGTFMCCESLKNITIPNSVTKIGELAFIYCDSLEQVSIPDSVSKIGEFAFLGCNSIKNFEVNPNNLQYTSLGGNLYNKNGSLLIQYALGKENPVFEIPNSVTEIEQFAFYGCKALAKLTIGGSVDRIYNYAIANCPSLTDVSIPYGAVISSDVFSNCPAICYNEYDNALYLGNDSNPYYMLMMVKHSSDVTTLRIHKDTRYIFDGEIVMYDSEGNLSCVSNLRDCSWITTLICEGNMPKTNSSYSSYATFDFPNLSTVILEDGVTNVANYTFSDRLNLTNIEVSENNQYYKSIDGNLYSKDGKTLIQYAPGKTNSTFAIPSTVTKIELYAFINAYSLTTLTFESNVPEYPTGSIYDYVTVQNYYSIPNLKTVILGKNVSNIDNLGLYQGDYYLLYLDNIEVDENNSYFKSIDGNLYSKDGTTILYYARGKRTPTFVIPETVTNIYGRAFSDCYWLVRVTIPESYVFDYESGKAELSDLFPSCYSLVEICYKCEGYVSTYNRYLLNIIAYESESKLKIVGDFVFYDDGSRVYLVKYIGNDTEIALPEYDGGKSYGIYNYAFYPANEKTSSFDYSSEKLHISVSDSVTFVDDFVFGNSESYLYSSHHYYYNYSFNEYENGYYIGNDENPYYIFVGPISYYKESYVVHSDTKIIVPNAFLNCNSVKTIELGDSIITIGYSAFSGCTSLTSIKIPNSVTSIDETAFYGCTSLQYNEYDNALYLGNDENPYLILVTAKDINITSCEIPSGTKFIHSYAFRDCTSLTSIVIPDSVTSIGSYAFSSCYHSLTSVTIGNSVTSIGRGAFDDCDSLKDIYYTGNIEKWLRISFSNYDSNPMYYGDNLYFEGELVTSIIIPDTVTSIGDSAFYGCSSLISVTIPDFVTSIGNSAFSCCSSLISVTIPNTVISIGDSAFSGCTSLTSVTIPDSVTSIGVSAFSGCTSLTSVTIGKSVTSIGNYTFRSTSITSVSIPSSVVSIGHEAFYNCDSLISVVIPDSVKSIGHEAFYNCDSLINVVIPDSVKSIGNYAFYNCDLLTIYCEAESQPSEWDSYWNYSRRPVVWGYKPE